MSFARGRNWQSRLLLLLAGAAAGGVVGLLLFGSPPARVMLEPAPQDQACPTAPITASAPLLSKLTEDGVSRYERAWEQHGGTGAPPGVSLAFDRCVTVLEFWGAPVWPARRQRWLNAVPSTVGVPVQLEVSRDLADQEQQVLAELAQTLEVLRVETATTTVAGPAPSESDRVPEDLRRAAVEVVALGDRRDDIHAMADLLARIPEHPTVEPPVTAVLAIAMGAGLGGLAAGIVGAGRRLLSPTTRASGRRTDTDTAATTGPNDSR